MVLMLQKLKEWLWDWKLGREEEISGFQLGFVEKV